MSRSITVSLPVADLKASRVFYTALGFVNNLNHPGFRGGPLV